MIVLSITNSWGNLNNDAQITAATASLRANEILDGYKTAFRSILIPIKDKLAENPSFDELQSWLQSKEEDFRCAVGEDAYDGIALTYQGGYAHSWNYGDYTNYVPSSRPWYQAAWAADGEVVIVAPYVTYLRTDNQAVATDILMTVAQKYTDEISFDLDLKLPKIRSILSDLKLRYPGEKAFIYNADGQILSTTTEEYFAHSIRQPDDIITKGIANMVKNFSYQKT